MQPGQNRPASLDNTGEQRETNTGSNDCDRADKPIKKGCLCQPVHWAIPGISQIKSTLSHKCLENNHRLKINFLDTKRCQPLFFFILFFNFRGVDAFKRELSYCQQRQVSEVLNLRKCQISDGITVNFVWYFKEKFFSLHRVG